MLSISQLIINYFHHGHLLADMLPKYFSCVQTSSFSVPFATLLRISCFNQQDKYAFGKLSNPEWAEQENSTVPTTRMSEIGIDNISDSELIPIVCSTFFTRARFRNLMEP